ncbi:MAG: hypothetical protein RL226_936 [Bacteroidota bacterium]
MFRIACFCVVLMVFSCTEPAPALPTKEPSLEKGLLLGIAVGDSISSLSKRVHLVAKNEQLYELVAQQLYEIPAEVHVVVSVVDSVVRHLDADIFPADSSTHRTLWDKLKEASTSIYGSGSENNGFAGWRMTSPEGTIHECFLFNESREVGKPYIRLEAYEQ